MTNSKRTLVCRAALPASVSIFPILDIAEKLGEVVPMRPSAAFADLLASKWSDGPADVGWVGL